MTFTTSTDDIVRRKTIGVFLLFTVIPVFNLFLGNQWPLHLVLLTFFMLLLLYSYLRKPANYQVDGNRIIIHRPIGNVEINIRDIERVDRINHDLLKNSARGGAFGYAGKFVTDLGKVTFYATRRDKMILLTKHDKTKIILTPDDEDKFIEDIEKKAGSQHEL